MQLGNGQRNRKLMVQSFVRMYFVWWLWALQGNFLCVK